MMPYNPAAKDVPLDIVGSSTFGRYPKISIAKTFNMIISDEWLVPYAGYKKVAFINSGAQGRDIYTSTRLQKQIVIVGSGVYTTQGASGFSYQVGTLDTEVGDVYIAENNAGQIAITDRLNIYIFDYVNGTFQKAVIDFVPVYISFQGTYFISADANRPVWRLSDNNNGLIWPIINTGEFQTKADKVVAVVPVPGKSNMVFVMGSVVTEAWYNTGEQLFPYTRSTFFNVDFGTVSAATVAWNDNVVIWVGINQQSGPVIMVSDGGEPKQISTDGINFQLARLTNPSNSYGYLFRQDGHQLYVVTFPDDNLTLAYDFNTNKFFNLSDRLMNYHISKRIAFYNNSYYFVSFNDGDLYELNTKYFDLDGEECPRVRVCSNFRLPDDSRFIINSLTIRVEQGQETSPQSLDLTISKDGGESFGQAIRKEFNAPGKASNRLVYWSLGAANDFVPQLRFWGHSRLIAANGVMSIYQ